MHDFWSTAMTIVSINKLIKNCPWNMFIGKDIYIYMPNRRVPKLNINAKKNKRNTMLNLVEAENAIKEK